MRITFANSADCEAAVSNGITYGDTPLHVSIVQPSFRLVYLRDCPCEVPDAIVRKFFASFGEVHSITPSEHGGFPGLYDGNRVIRMSITKDIPGSVRVAGFDCRVWYRRQPAFRAICRKTRHRGKPCP